MKPLVVSAMAMALGSVLGLTGCADPNLQPQSANQAGSSAAAGKPPAVQHNLSRVTTAKAVSPEMLATLKEGLTTKVELVELLGDSKPFLLGDGKQIYRYDVGKFIFDANGVLIRRYLNH